MSSKHILLVEDEALIALDIETTLIEAGHRVSSARSRSAAQGLLGKEQFDLAIIDFHLPDGDSATLAQQLNEMGVPFVVCSGTAGLSELGGVFAEARFLAKPFSSDALLDTIVTVDTPSLH